MTQQEHNNDNAFFPPLFAVLRSITAMFRENRTLRAENAELRVHIQQAADEHTLLSAMAALAGDRRASTCAKERADKHLAALQKEPNK